MMIDRKEAKRAARERVTAKGVFALRCTASGEAWVSSSRDLKASETGLFFALRLGSHINKPMQAAWNQHGPESFRFEVLEEVDGDVLPMALTDTLKARQKYWRTELGAGAV
jgi:hypothetical protein